MKIIWTDFAIQNIKAIFDYHVENATKKVAHKIKNEIFKATKQLIKHPDSGQVEPNLYFFQQNHRYLVCGNYKIVYKVFEHQIIINDVFDTRQNPDKIAKGI